MHQVENFNPRTRMGCDRDRREELPRAKISIHAPAWGATVNIPANPNALKFQSTHPHGVRHSSSALSSYIFKFQSTHPHGVRQHILQNGRCQLQFQSTHPHGVRRSSALIYFLIMNFNPRTRMGCDPLLCPSCPCLSISIHAPAWGATKQNST